MRRLLVVSIEMSLMAERQQTKRAIRQGLAVLATLLACVPVSAFLTLLLMPVWRWVEEHTGVESVGHSGPAEWCFGVTFVACVVALASLYAFRGRSAAE